MDHTQRPFITKSLFKSTCVMPTHLQIRINLWITTRVFRLGWITLTFSKLNHIWNFEYIMFVRLENGKYMSQHVPITSLIYNTLDKKSISWMLQRKVLSLNIVYHYLPWKRKWLYRDFWYVRNTSDFGFLTYCRRQKELLKDSYSSLLILTSTFYEFDKIHL